MPRRKLGRKVFAPPKFDGYKPFNCESKGTINLYYEEYEALKLTDYHYKKHEEAAELMKVSRATFARIYESARRKIASAMVETKEIHTVKGHAHFDAYWFVCRDCNARFKEIRRNRILYCPVCSTSEIRAIN